jgi:EF hand
MKCNLAWAILAVACAATLAVAQNQQPGFDQAKAFAELQRQMLQQFDANRDGQLTGQEQLLAQEAMRRQGINLGMPPGGFPGSEQFNKQFDRDGDGKLNQVEMMAAQRAYQQMRNGSKGGGIQRGGPIPQPSVEPPPEKPSKVSPLIKRFDKDGDGKLNAAEKEAAQAELKKTKPKEAKEKDAKDKDEKDKEAKDEKGK